MQEIKNLVEERGIRYLVHFTRLKNLESILQFGLIPRSEFENHNIQSTVNDSLRLDNCLGATSLSIEFPNYKMFYKYRNETSEKWTVIGLKPEILWEKDCVFCSTNAANSSVSRLALDKRKGYNALNKMFDEIINKPSRQEMGVSERYATDPQAEILVFDKIEPRYIMGATFNEHFLVLSFKKRFRSYNFRLYPTFFGARKDYQHW